LFPQSENTTFGVGKGKNIFEDFSIWNLSSFSVFQRIVILLLILFKTLTTVEIPEYPSALK